jgi:TetR/AcrR family transcriptional regulator, tetracycline repressor protein
LLTEAQIVEAALKLAGDASLEDVSMRALARELGVPVMTVYNYVPSKEALYELVLNHVLRPVRVPSPESGSWVERMRRLQTDARRALGNYPGLSLSRHGGGSAESARLAEGVLSILSSAGFGPDESALVFATLYTFVTGQLEVDATAELTGRAEATLDAVTSPAKVSRDKAFEFGLDAVIEGLKAKVANERQQRSRARARATGRAPSQTSRHS